LSYSSFRKDFQHYILFIELT